MNDLALAGAPVTVVEQPKYNPAVVLCNLVSELTRMNHLSNLGTIARLFDSSADPLTFPWQNLRVEHVAAIQKKLAAEYSTATVNKFIRVLKAVMRTSWRMKLIPTRDYMALEQVRPLRETKIFRAAVTPDEFDRLINAGPGDARGHRNRALLALLYAGLRLEEARTLQLSDWTAETGAIHVSHGKGNKERVTYVVPPYGDAIEKWLDIRGRHEGPVITPSDDFMRSVHARSVTNILDRCCLQAHLRRVKPHHLRASFITNLLTRNVDVLVIGALVGHTRADTTRIYDLRGEDDKRAAVERLRR